MKTKLLIITVLSVLFNVELFSQNTNVETNSKKQNHIVDYFLEIPTSDLKINMEERRKTLKAKNLQELWDVYEGYYLMDTIDYKNGFLSFHSTGDGSGSNYELTYYILKDKSRLIALNTTVWVMCCESSSIKFYKIINEKWINVTETVMPKITLYNFFPENLIKDKIDHDLIENPPIVAVLPQKGKTIKLTLDLQTFYDYTDDLSDEEFDHIWKNMICLRFDLIWNDGNFTIGNKSIGDFQRDMYGNIISKP